jgi:yecA family protein
MAYQIINEIVVQSDAELSAAEAHGMATGMLCGDENVQSDAWLAELLRNASPVTDEGRAILAHLFEGTKSLLGSEDFEFNLLLPGDDTLLSERVEALTHWCKGFLLGVGFAHPSADWSRDVTEILKDIAEFTKLDTEAEGEEDEGDYMEITEYLRPAVLLLRSELNKGDER